MDIQNSPQRFTPLDTISTERPVLFIDTRASLTDLHACLNERLNAAKKMQTLFTCCTFNDSDPRDISDIADVTRILLQDASDVFAVIEARGLAALRQGLGSSAAAR
ncbi:fructose-bisphosphate aldolase [Pseudomonas chlororaphis]|nr:fructose-bisphosphate aldolase [Pseudomonas chlororaphis]